MLWNPIRAIRVNERRAGTGHEDVLHGSEYHEMRPHSFARRDPTVECDERVDDSRGPRDLTCPARTLEFLHTLCACAPSKDVRNIRLILA